jgi:hypothetical protein
MKRREFIALFGGTPSSIQVEPARQATKTIPIECSQPTPIRSASDTWQVWHGPVATLLAYP